MNELNLNEIQSASLSVLDKLVEIINQLNLHYSLAWGTLLGAVRHQGFIPWDDDIDIMMPRPDYEKLLDFCIKNQDEILPYNLINIRSNDNYVYVLSRFSDSRYTVDYTNVRNYGLGVFVDIYPIDGLGTNYEKAKYYNRRNALKKRLAKLLEPDKFLKSPNGIFKTILKYPSYIIAKLIGRQRLLKSVDNSCSSVSYSESSFVGIPTVEIEDKYIMPKDWFDSYEFLLFETNKYSVISKYKEFLKQRYGDYMKLPPENERIAHHYYSVYKK